MASVTLATEATDVQMLSRRRISKRIGCQVLERERYQTEPDRYDYRLTQKGTGLGAVVAEMLRWSQRWRVDTEVSDPATDSLSRTFPAGRVAPGGRP